MITKLENKFEDLKEQFSKEQIVLVFAKFEAENLLEETALALNLLKNTSEEDETKRRFVALHKQVKEFLELVEDLIEMRKSHGL